jgi:thiamine pyrophosphokinase
LTEGGIDIRFQTIIWIDNNYQSDGYLLHTRHSVFFRSMREMTLFLILLGGELTVTERLTRQISGARVIAADSGMKHAAALGVRPELWVGDFDSSDAALQARCADVPRLAFPADKARTDGDLAIDEALKRGATRLVLAGALGGPRSDHAAHHLMKMLALAQEGIDVFLTSGGEEAWPLLPGTRQFDVAPGTVFSIIALESLRELSVSGVKWELSGADVALGSSLTLSNVALAAPIMALKQGRAVVFTTITER